MGQKTPLSRRFRCEASTVGSILEEVKALGATVEGDEHSGKLVGQTFIGRFEGTYHHDGEHLTLTITQRPSVISDDLLSNRLDELAQRYGLS
ncbi:MAG: hypothetical protein ACE5ID_04455 [Acidobacteriota bacterium]